VKQLMAAVGAAGANKTFSRAEAGCAWLLSLELFDGLLEGGGGGSEGVFLGNTRE
jgi:hypothetical protein